MAMHSTSEPAAAATAPPLLEVRQVSFRYGDKQALDQIDMRLEAGRFHALLGPNGAGKSTLFNLISRLYQLQQGDILLDGQSLARSRSAVLASMGMVFQQSTLDLELSVTENLLYHGSLQGISRRECKRRIDEELERFQMSDRRNAKVRQLNGGHRRRVEIARALLHRPRLLLLDEATVGLDPDARKSINRHVRQLCQEQQLGVLWATHLIEEIDDDDPVTLLYQGKVRADDLSRNICRDSDSQNLVQAFERLTSHRVEENTAL